jgi:HEAT repeat protein
MKEEGLERAELLAALGGDGDARRRALSLLAACTPEDRRRLLDREVAKGLVSLLADASRTRQRQAADGMRTLLGEATPLGEVLREALLAPDARLRWGAAYTLGHAVPPPRAIWPAVWETLGLTDGDQRWAAAELACKLARHHPDVLDDLRAALPTGSPVQRKMVLYCLRDLGADEAASLSMERLQDPDAGVRLAALSVISCAAFSAEQRDACADAVARLVVEDAAPGVRRAAAVTLGKLGARTLAACSALEQAASGEDESLARAASAALARGRPIPREGESR